MDIIWSEASRRDITSHIAYVADRNPDAAERVYDSILIAVQRLAEFPYSGRPGRLEGQRELVMPDLPYVIVYIVRESTVYVVRFMHGAQLWPPEGE